MSASGVVTAGIRAMAPSSASSPSRGGDARAAATSTGSGSGGGTPSARGRLEVAHGGAWGTVCAQGFTQDEAVVACRQVRLLDGWVVAARESSGGVSVGCSVVRRMCLVANPEAVVACRQVSAIG